MKKILLIVFVLITSFSFSQAADMSCDIQDENDMLVFEAERFELKGDWRLGTDAKASGGKYIYFSGPNAYQERRPQNDISYTFNIVNPGSYTLKWTMRQPEEERGTDLGNDAWFYFSGDIARGSEGVLDHYYKFVGRSDENFTLNGTAEVHHKSTWVTVDFPTAGAYTLNLSGRSHAFELDRIVLYKNKSSIDIVDVEIQSFAETTTCDDKIDQESVEIVDVAENYPNKQSKIPFKINYITTDDRDILISVKDSSGTILQTERRTLNDSVGILTIDYELDNELSVANGYSFEAQLVPQGGDSTQGTAMIEEMFDIVQGDVPPEKDEVMLINPPKEFANTSKEVVARVAYSATTSRDIILAINTPTGGFFKNAKSVVPLGTGEVDVKIVLTRSMWNSKGYKLTAMLRPNGGNFSTNLDKEIVTFDVVSESQLSIEDLNKEGISVLENPFKDTFRYTNNGKIVSASLYSLMGQKIITTLALENENAMPTSDLASGVYFVVFKFKDGSIASIKVIKE